jgi:hypothetical protein
MAGVAAIRAQIHGIAAVSPLVRGRQQLINGRYALVAFLSAVLTGVFFGWYPASPAATTDPIEALSHD